MYPDLDLPKLMFLQIISRSQPDIIVASVVCACISSSGFPLPAMFVTCDVSLKIFESHDLVAL